MTETSKDRQLIVQAFIADDWNQIKELEDQAESEGAKLILHDRKIHLYRKEEAFANQL